MRSHLAIAAASAAVAMHPQTLRKYERAGLLRPGRRTGGSRHYSADDLARLALIKQLAEVRRINVAGMSLVLAIRDGLESLLDTIDGEDPRHLGKVARARISAIVRLIDDGGPATGE